MKKNFLKITILILLFTILSTISICYATTSASEFASILSSSELTGFESEMNTTLEAASLTYQHRGYRVFKLKDPSALTLLSNLNSSNVQLFYCHGGLDYVQFKDCGLCLGKSTTIDGREYQSAEGIDWSTKKLVTLAACKTAGIDSPDSNAIAPQLAVMGAQATIGWYSKIWTFSSCDWLDNFHDKIYKGYNVLDAVNYANSKNYAFPTVKNVTLSYRSLSPLSNDSTIDKEILQSNKNLLKNKDIGKLNVSNAETIIKQNNSSFDVNQYEKQISEGLYTYNVEKNEMKKNYSYIDYNLKIGDFITNSGYTVILDENDNILQICDNTVDIYEETYRKNSNYYNVSDSDSNYYLSKAKEQISSKYTILNENIAFGYDVNKNKKYAYIDFEVQLSTGKSQNEYFSFEIK